MNRWKALLSDLLLLAVAFGVLHQNLMLLSYIGGTERILHGQTIMEPSTTIATTWQTKPDASKPAEPYTYAATKGSNETITTFAERTAGEIAVLKQQFPPV